MPAPRRRVFAYALLAAAWAVPISVLAQGPAANAASATAPAAPREKAIFAVSDADTDKWRLTLGNIANALQALGPEGADLELVAYGPGIDMLKSDSPVARQLAEVIAKGVRVAACRNSMRAHHLESADLAPGIEIVPSGVVELMRRQHEGYAYIRS